MRIFLDSGDPKETRQALAVLGELDGQTTNPSLIAKHPEAQEKKFTVSEIETFYQRVVKEISDLLPKGSVSVEVYADLETKAEQMVEQGKIYNSWIPNAHIKLPITKEGLKAAALLVSAGVNVNMTLCFSQDQAAAVYAATLGAKKGQVFISPFLGRLDDIGLRGMSLVENILKMYQQGDGHVEVLAASIRSVRHIKETVSVQADILTAPLNILTEWKTGPAPSMAASPELSPIAYKELDLNQSVESYNIFHELTEKGLKKFVEDWNNLLV